MSQRYFRTADASMYEQIRLGLDAAWGHPTAGTVTCIDPAAVAPHDAQGRILLAVKPEFTEFPAAAAMLPDLLASGQVVEITDAEYRASLPQTP
jgi:hypothetical protein